MTHDELQNLLGAYALDAVDPDEAEAVELHLRTCPRCQAEVQAHRDTASWLAHGGAPAPDGVWEKIAGGLEEAAPPLDVGRILPWETRESRASRGRSNRRRRPVVEWVAGIAAVLVLVLGGVAVDQQRRLDRLDNANALQAAFAQASANPHARQVTLQSTSGVAAHVRAVVLPDGTGYLAAAPLDDAGQARTYQLWGINDARVVSLGVLGSDPQIVAFHAAPDIRTLAITEEVAGGVVVSHNQPVVAGKLTA
jgi:anti-sigma factor RsiW